jgi:RNA polymerase sigma-70 factor (family 1)
LIAFKPLIDLPRYEDRQLLLAVAGGDEEAFARLYARFGPMLFPYVLKIVKMPPLAEDILQDIFLKVWESREKLPDVNHLPAYLFTVARNHTLNTLQNLSRSQQAMTAMVDHYRVHRFDDEVLVKDYRQFVENVLQTIPSRSRDIFRKCREEGMSYEDVAGEIGISRNAVKRHMVNTLRTLKEAVGRDLGITLETLLLVVSIYACSGK